MIRSAWRIWKRFRWKNLVRVWAVFMAIALVLLAQTLGIHYGATKFTLKYMARNEAIPAQNAIMGQRATNLMLVDSSQDGVDEAEAMMKQVLLDMKVPTATVDLAKTDPDDIPSLNRYRTVLIVMPELDSLGDELVSIMRWVEGGGNMMLAMTPEKTGYLDAIGPQIGIESSAYDYVMTKGIKPARDFMLGGGHTYMFSGPFKSSLSLNLNEKATVEAVSVNGHTPLIWECRCAFRTNRDLQYRHLWQGGALASMPPRSACWVPPRHTRSSTAPRSIWTIFHPRSPAETPPTSNATTA